MVGPLSGTAAPVRSALIWSGVAVGRCESSSAAAPVTTAAAWEVPLPRKKRPPTVAVLPNCPSSAEPGSRRLAMWVPGATRSGLRVALPLSEKVATVSSEVSAVPLVSTAPAAIT